MADVVIPRGAENTVAIDLVSKHLIYQLDKYISKNSNSSYFDNVVNFSNHEIFDPKYQFQHEKIIIWEDDSKLDTLKSIFTDFVNNSRFHYSQMFLDYLVNNVLLLYTSKYQLDKDFVFITEKNIDDSYGLRSNKTIVYFQPYILKENDLKIIE
jgi:hypothetical protein